MTKSIYFCGGQICDELQGERNSLSARICQTGSPPVMQVDKLMGLPDVAHDIEFAHGLSPSHAQGRSPGLESFAFQRIFCPIASRCQKFRSVVIFQENIHKSGKVFSISAVLEQHDRHANSAKDQSGDDGPKKNNGFTALLPRRLPVESQLAQQINRRMFWLDASSMRPIPQMSMSKWIYFRLANSPQKTTASCRRGYAGLPC